MEGYFEHPFARIYYRTMGRGIPVVHLHGYELDHTTMLYWLEPLYKGRSGIKRIYLDLPGMGQSQVNHKLKIAEQMVEAVTDCIKYLLKDKPFHLVGLSYGGYLVLRMCSDLADQVMSGLLIVPVIKAYFRDRKIPPFRIGQKDEKFIRSLSPQEYNGIKDWMVVQTQETFERTRDEVHPSMQKGDKKFLKRFAGKGYGFADEAEFLQTPIITPMLFISGREDTMVGYEDAAELAAIYPNTDIMVFANAGHNLPIEQSGKFNAVVSAWMELHYK